MTGNAFKYDSDFVEVVESVATGTLEMVLIELASMLKWFLETVLPRSLFTDTNQPL